MKKLYSVQLTDQQRSQLQQLITSGSNKARVLTRARAMLLLDQDRADKEIVAALAISPTTVQRIRQRFSEHGFAAALHDKTHPGRPALITGDVEAKLVLLACSSPPQGRARWSLQLLADKMVELHYVEHISHQHVANILKKTNSSPGASNVGASPKQTRAS